MQCYKTFGRTANFAAEGRILCISTRKESFRHKCCASLHTKDKIFKYDTEGQTMLVSGVYKFGTKHILPVTVCVSYNFDRNISTSNRCLTVKIDQKKNYYHILGVTPQCSNTKIKQAYYRLSKVFHPDVNKTKAAVVRFHEVTEAYEVLSTPALRHIYDTGRVGKLHGAHRVVVKPHPVNFAAKGPHQIRKNDKQEFDHRMKSHYSKHFKRLQVDLRKHEEKNYLHSHDLDTHGIRTDKVEWQAAVFLSTVFVGIAYLVYRLSE